MTKEVIEYLMPPVLLDLARYIRQNVSGLGIRKSLKGNSQWESRYAGEKVYVLGNGPSLSLTDISALKGKKVIVMNSFERAPWKCDVEIVAHCIGEPRLSPSWGDHITASINGTDAASYWLHYSSMDRLQGVDLGKQLHYVFPSIEAGLWRRKRNVRLDASTLGYATTAQLAILVALYMGFKEIILLGFDHDWLASPKYLKHFYSDKKDPEDTLDRHNYISIIEFSRRMWRIYYTIRNIAEFQKAEIFNCSKKSYLDVFQSRDAL